MATNHDSDREDDLGVAEGSDRGGRADGDRAGDDRADDDGLGESAGDHVRVVTVGGVNFREEEMAGAAVPLQAEGQWTEGLTVNRHGIPLGTLRNVMHALHNAPDWAGVLAHDEFQTRTITIKPPPWGAEPVAQWTDDCDLRASLWCQEKGINAPIGTVARAIQSVARENMVHPVRDYLDVVRWDGTPRLDTMLTSYFGVEDNRYARAVGSRFLISAVARVFRPGSQVDSMLILEGNQGVQKSTALRALAEPWFTDRLSGLGTKDAAVELGGVWLVEMAELDALTKASNSSIKAFVTRRHDRFRPPYARYVVDMPRQCVFTGTINPVGGYLKDPTGARRFWPVKCGAIKLDALRRDRNQLWAEAVARFRDGAPWHLETAELEALATAEQEARYEVDPWQEAVGTWLVGRNDVSVGEVLIGALGYPRDRWAHSSEIRVAKILKRIGFEQYRPGKAGQARTPRYRRDALDHQDGAREIKLTKKVD